MSQFHGTQGSLTIGGTVGELRGYSIDHTAETYQSKFPTAGDPSPSLEYIAGPKSWSGSATVYYDTNDAGQDSAVGATETITALLEDATTDGTLGGSVIITGLSVTHSVDGLNEATITFQGSGALTITQSA